MHLQRWAYYVGNRINEGSYYAFMDHKSLLKKVIPAWFEVDWQGTFVDNIQPALKQRLVTAIPTTPLVRNKSFSRQEVDALLSLYSRWEFFIEKWQKLMQENSYRGLNLDLEYVSPNRGKNLNQFVRLLTHHFPVTVSVPAKTHDELASNWTGAFDYKTLGGTAEALIIMGYDFHWAGGNPGPVAPISWLRRVLVYATGLVAPHRLYLGLPGYGYDWTEGEPGRALSYQQAENLRLNHGAALLWHEEAAAPHFNYEQEDRRHQVWFENYESLRAKVQLALAFGLGGICLWRLGLEDPSFWDLF